MFLAEGAILLMEMRTPLNIEKPPTLANAARAGAPAISKPLKTCLASKIFSHFKGWRARPRRNGSVVLVVIGGWTRLWDGFNLRMLRAPDETALLVWRNFLAAFAVSPARPLH